MKKTKKNKPYKKKSIKNKLNDYEKTLIELYNSAKFEKIGKIPENQFFRAIPCHSTKCR